MRERLGFKRQSDLAKELDLSIGTVSAWEVGARTPSYDVLKRLLELGATTEELFGVDCRPHCPNAVKQPPEDAMVAIMRRLEALESGRLDQPSKAG